MPQAPILDERQRVVLQSTPTSAQIMCLMRSLINWDAAVDFYKEFELYTDPRIGSTPKR